MIYLLSIFKGHFTATNHTVHVAHVFNCARISRQVCGQTMSRVNRYTVNSIVLVR